MNQSRLPQFNLRKVCVGLLIVLTDLAGRADSTADPATLAAANTGFAFDLFKQIAREQPDANVFISPFSVSTVLQMVGNGAAGETKSEMQSVLKTAGVPTDMLNAACRDLNQSLNSQTNVVLDLANAIWYQDGIRLKPGFVSANQNYFLAKLAGVDFKSPGSAQTINHWADQSTRGKIREVVRWPLPPLTRLVLANAVYFKGKWEHPFATNQTRPQVFHSAHGDRQVPMMGQRGRFSYQEGDGYQAVRLPYSGGRLHMCLFLPETNSSPAKLLADFNGESWRNIILSRFRDREGTLALPRFKLNYDVELNEPLEALGMRRAFTPGADFSAMADEPLFVSEVKQKSYVEVNEEGTEAAAVTTGMMRATAMIRPLEPFEMIVDRPFFFVIEDKQTGTFLFAGVVYDPGS